MLISLALALIMSAALVRRSLALVDEGYMPVNLKKKKRVLDLQPENQKVTKQISRKGHKTAKINLLKCEKKLTVSDVKRQHKTKEQIVKENLEKLKLIRETCAIELDKEVTRQLVQRAVTRRPIKKKKSKKAIKKTAFTEEDFRRFEQEYFDEDL